MAHRQPGEPQVFIRFKSVPEHNDSMAASSARILAIRERAAAAVSLAMRFGMDKVLFTEPNLGNKATRRAYENALKGFMSFIGIAQAGEFGGVTRAHV